MRRLPTRIPWAGVLIALLLVLATASVLRTLHNVPLLSQDFSVRWVTTRTMLHGENPYAMEVTGQRSPFVQGLLQRYPQILFSTTYVPASQLSILPFALLPYPVAAGLWLVSNAIAVAVMLYLVFRLPGAPRAPSAILIATLLFIASSPLRETLANGQSGIIAMALLLAAHAASERGKPLLSGALLALSSVKYHITLPFALFLFLLERRWSPVLASGGILILGHVFFCALMGVSPIAVVTDLASLTVHDGMYDESPDVYTIATRRLGLGVGPGVAVTGAFIGAFAILWMRRRRAGRLAEWASLALLTLVLPTHRIHDFFLLILPLLAAFQPPHGLWTKALALGTALYFFFGYRLLQKLGVDQSILTILAAAMLQPASAVLVTRFLARSGPIAPDDRLARETR